MRRPRRGRPIRLIAALVALAIAVTGFVVARVSAASPTAVTVMTRNLYLGADITRPLRAAQGLTGPGALLALGHANDELRRVVGQTDFGVRSRLLAAEVTRSRPDLLGLQEVALWRHGPLQLDHLGRTDATTVDQDFLALLLTELERGGVGYDVVQVQPESDVEAPAFVGDPVGRPVSGTATDARDVRLTMRDVILLRRGSGLQIDDRGSGQYVRRLDVELGGVAYSFIRGYAWADVTAGATRFRFLTTHLESQSAALAAAQAQELLAGPARTDLTTVVVCDCNSNPPRGAAYRLLTQRGQLRDTWLMQTDPGPGSTATFGEAVDDATAAGLDRRLDLVLVRPAFFGRATATAAELTGVAPSDRDPTTGLWPSDHAGVVVQLRLGGH